MGIKVTKTPKWDKYKKRLKKTDSILASVAEGAIVGIINRTQSGRDKNNKGFKGYSSEYGKTGVVNLTDTNTMLHSMDRKKIRGGVKIFFQPTKGISKRQSKKKSKEAVKNTDLAYYQDRVLGRHFFGLDKTQKLQIKQRIGKFLVKGLK